MTVRINSDDCWNQSIDVQVENGGMYDIISGVDEVYIGRERLNIPPCTLRHIDCCAYAVAVTLDGRKVLMVSP